MSKAATTRTMILQKAFELVYVHGYQATSIDSIIATTQVTKGAFYHHFKTKDDMGLALINEVMYPGMYQALVLPLANAEDPLDEIYHMMAHVLLEDPFFQVKYGCPAINLIEEMPPLNDIFSQALARLVIQWQEAIANNITRAQHTGRVRKEVNAVQVACFITAGYGGIRNLGKIFGKSCYHTYLEELKSYLKQLS